MREYRCIKSQGRLFIQQRCRGRSIKRIANSIPSGSSGRCCKVRPRIKRGKAYCGGRAACQGPYFTRIYYSHITITVCHSYTTSNSCSSDSIRIIHSRIIYSASIRVGHFNLLVDIHAICNCSNALGHGRYRAGICRGNAAIQTGACTQIYSHSAAGYGQHHHHGYNQCQNLLHVLSPLLYPRVRGEGLVGARGCRAGSVRVGGGQPGLSRLFPLPGQAIIPRIPPLAPGPPTGGRPRSSGFPYSGGCPGCTGYPCSGDRPGVGSFASHNTTSPRAGAKRLVPSPPAVDYHQRQHGKGGKRRREEGL